ncbi:hypothetical protein BH10PSE19_BH10PSE19_10140 [soil metagenome]
MDDYKPYIVTEADVRKFIEEKGTAKKCSVCHDPKEEWSLFGSEEMKFHPLIFKTVGSQADLAVHCYTLMCNNCGHLINFSKWMVQRWLESKTQVNI